MKISKSILLLIIAVLPTLVYSQKRITFGIQGGVNYSSLRFENDLIIEHDSEISYLFGISSNISLRKKLSLQVELNYEKKRVSVFSPETVINGVNLNSYRIFDVYDFLTLPVMLRYEIGNKNPFYLSGGMFLGYLLKARERVNDGELSQDLSEYFTNFDAGFSIGLGKYFLLNDSNKLIIELRNNLGLINIDKDPKSQYTRTNSLNFIVGWNFIL